MPQRDLNAGDLKKKKEKMRSDPEIPVPPGDEHYVLDTSLDKVSFALQ